jgi:hypothetical protein
MNVVNGTPACVVAGADTCDFKVSYYDLSSGGTLQFAENFQNVEIGNYGGVFDLTLGSGTSVSGLYSTLSATLFANPNNLYIQIEFAPNGTTLTETFTRMPLEASGYSILAKRSTSALGDLSGSGFVFNPIAANPTNTEGRVYYNNSTKTLKMYNGTAWVDLTTGASSVWGEGNLSSLTYSQYMATTGIGTFGPFTVDTDEERVSINGDGAKSGLSVYSNYNSSTTFPVVSFMADHSSFTGTILSLIQDGTGKLLTGYKGSSLEFEFDNRGDLHLNTDGMMYFEPFASAPSSFYPNSGEGCMYSYGGDIYWDPTCNGTPELLNMAASPSLWTDAGTFTHLTSVTDDLILGANTVAGATFVFDMDASGGNYFEIDNADNSSRLFTIAANGNVGIGTSSPGAKLDIGGASSVISNTTGDITITPNANLIFSSGNVGIGETTPLAKLHIKGSANDEQLIVQGYSTQTAPLILALDSSGNELFRINSNNGSNLFIGKGVGEAITSGGGNTAVGYYSLYYNTTGNLNSAFGEYSLENNTTGLVNTALGMQSLEYNTSGSYNTGVGYLAGSKITGGNISNTTGSYSLFLGAKTKAMADNETNQIVIGYDAVGVGSNSVVLGNDSITKTILKGNVGIGTTSTPDALTISGSSSLGVRAAVTNTNASGFAEMATFNNASAKGSVFKTGSSYAGYKIVQANDFGIYNTTSGNISFLNDYGSGNISFAAGAASTPQLFVKWNGNVGIGTADPQKQLHIKTTSGEAFEYEGNNTIGVRMRFNPTATGGRIWDIGATADGATGEGGGGKFMIRDGTGSNTPFVIDSSGRVGIGTVNPSEKLQVAGQIRSQLDTAATGWVGLQAGNTAAAGYVQWYRPDDNRIAYLGWNGGGTNNLGLNLENGAGFNINNGNVGINIGNSNPAITLAIGDSDTGFKWVSDGNFMLVSNSAERMRITSSGTVTVTGTIDFGSQALGYASDSASAPSFSWTGDTNVGMFRPTTDTIGFTTNGSERMRITSGGYVGIGTTNPQSLLELDGGVSLTNAFTIGSTNRVSIQSVTDSANSYRRWFMGGSVLWEPSSDRWRIYPQGGSFNDFAGMSMGNGGSLDFYAGNVSAASPYASLTDAQMNGYKRITIASDGKVGINNPGPSARFHVTESSGGSYTARIENTASSFSQYQSVLELNVSDQTGSDYEYFILMNKVGPLDTKFRFATSGKGFSDGGWTTPADYAEYFETNDTHLDKGHLVSLDPNNATLVKFASSSDKSQLFGVVSTKPGIVGAYVDDVTEDTIGMAENPRFKIVGILGQIPTYVTNENGPIKYGDPITISSKPGIGAKALSAGYIVGRAMESYNSSVPGKIRVLVQASWYDPNASVSVVGGLNLLPGRVDTLELSTASLQTQINDLKAQILAINPANSTNNNIINADTILAKMNIVEEVLVISGDTKVLGKATFKDINVGTISLTNNQIGIKGTTCVDEQGKANLALCEVNTLYVQKDKSGNVNFFNGAVVLDPTGKVTAGRLEIKEESQTIGSGTILTGETSVVIPSNKITTTSKIFVTATNSTNGQNIYVSAKIEGTSFTVSIQNVVEGDVTFDWFVVNSVPINNI